MQNMRWSRIANIDLSPIFPSLCGAEDDGEGQPNAGGAGEGNNGGEGNADDRDPQKKIAALNEEKDRHFAQAKAAKDKLEELTPELEELRKFKQEQEQAKLSADEKVEKQMKDTEAERDQYKAKAESLSAAMQKLVLQQAFLTNSGVKWHDPEIALGKVDLSDVQIEENEEGIPVVKNPEALKKAAEKLASEKKFLVDAGTEERQPWRSSGPAAGNKDKRKAGESQEDRKTSLGRKYPALQR